MNIAKEYFNYSSVMSQFHNKTLLNRVLKGLSELEEGKLLRC